MAEFLQSVLLTFVPLFIVLDAPGNLPFVVSLSDGMSSGERRHFVNVTVVTAALVGLGFLLFGQAVLALMGISVGSFAIAGGMILLVLSVKYMTAGKSAEPVREELVAVVPMGTPLTVGPATVTTLILLAIQYDLWIVLLSFLLNIGVVWLFYRASEWFYRYLGRAGLKAVSQVFNLLLAALGINMVLRGLDLVGMFRLTL